MAAVARRSGGVLDVMRGVAAGPEPVLRPTDADVELRYCSTYRVQELLGLLHPSPKWSRSRKEQPVLRSRWVVLLVTETESDAALYMRPLGRPRKEKEEGKKRPSKQARQARERRKQRKKRRNRNQPRKEGSAEVEDEKKGQKTADK